MKVQEKRICILGLGHVGLTLALVMAEKGFTVIGYDIDENLIDIINQKKSPILEPNLENYLDKYLGDKFFATTDLNEISADIYIITVGTPIDSKTKLPKISFIENASRSIGGKIKKDDIVILRSTVPIGVSRSVVAPILTESSRLKCGSDFCLSYAPERTIEGEALKELSELPQIVGGFNLESCSKSKQIFSVITKNIVDVKSLESAEMVKIMNNTFRDVKFGYANEMAMICKDLGLDMAQLVEFANDGYKRDKIPTPSPGVGGACLSKDSYILSYSVKDIKHKSNIVSLARETNENIPKEIVSSIDAALSKLNKKLENSKIYIIGFAFKGNPETADLRGSTTIDFLNELKFKTPNSQSIFGYDPVIKSNKIDDLNIQYSSYAEGFKDADVILFMNNHLSYKSLDIENLLKTASKDCIFFDAWHLFAPSSISSINKINYQGVGV